MSFQIDEARVLTLDMILKSVSWVDLGHMLTIYVILLVLIINVELSHPNHSRVTFSSLRFLCATLDEAMALANSLTLKSL